MPMDLPVLTLPAGVPMSEILKKAGVTKPGPGRRFVCFAGPQNELPMQYDNQQGGPGSYGTSIDIETALDPSCDVIVAYKQNGDYLHPDHGFPCRLLIPGYIGGRMVKWLSEIEVADSESNNYFHYNDNRVLPPHVDAEKATAEGKLERSVLLVRPGDRKPLWCDEALCCTAGWWFKPEYIINQLNINGAIGYPWHNDSISCLDNRLKFFGYAYSGGGRKVSSAC